jgi:3-methyladenine DNA glycosylase/8-oxoguanine DNA glycosylase
MEAIIVALVTAVGGVIAILVQKSREENKEDHNTVINHLIELNKNIFHIDVKVENLDEKLDEHIASTSHYIGNKSKDKVKKK